MTRLSVTQFSRFMGSGRTSPMLCGCETEDGTAAGEFVVKLRGGMDRGGTGLASELIGSRLAAHFGLSTPEPAVVEFEDAMVRLIAARAGEKAAIVMNSVGSNFGTRVLTDATTWPVDKPIPDGMRKAALAVFALDGLLQNPDRRFTNTNLLTSGNSIFVFDHELAFSFLEEILPSGEPWRVSRLPFLSDHVFFRQLRGTEIEMGPFLARLRVLPQLALGEVLAEVPPEWNNGCVERIGQHIRDVADHSEEFGEEIRRVLA